MKIGTFDRVWLKVINLFLNIFTYFTFSFKFKKGLKTRKRLEIKSLTPSFNLAYKTRFLVWEKCCNSETNKIFAIVAAFHSSAICVFVFLGLFILVEFSLWVAGWQVGVGRLKAGPWARLNLLLMLVYSAIT